MASLDRSNLTPADGWNHLAEAERQAAVAAEAGRQAGLHLARHLVEAERQAAREAARASLENVKNIESKKPPLAHKFRRWCLDEMHISLSTGYKYVALGKIKIFRLGGCTMITDEESRRVLTEGVR